MGRAKPFRKLALSALLVPADDYEIGRGKPPKTYQFQKGQSGNLSGRPHRPPLSIADLIEKTLMQKVETSERGKVRKRTRLELILRQIEAKLLKKPSRYLLRIEGKYQTFAETQPVRRKSPKPNK